MPLHDAPLPRTPEVEEWLTARDIKFAVALLDPNKVDTPTSLTNQARIDNPLDQDVVARYAADMERGEQFPPVIVRRRGNLLIAIGGNHRLAAAKATGRQLAAYLIECDDPTALLLAIEDNRRHGVPLSDGERLFHAMQLVQAGTHQPGEAADVCGIPRSKVWAQIAANRSRARAAQLDLDGWDKLTITTLSYLDRVKPDGVFAALVQGIHHGTVRIHELTKVVARVNALDENAALAYLDEHTGSGYRWRPGQGHPPNRDRAPRVRLLHDLDRLLEYDADVVVADCLSQDQRAQVLNQIRIAGRRLVAVAQAVERANQ